MAFDQGNKRLYAVDQEAQKIHGFDASTPSARTPLGGSFPLDAPGAGFLDDIAADSASHDLYFISNGEQSFFGFNESGAPLPGFPVDGFSGPCGDAVDPSGNIWVGDFVPKEISEYDSSGNPVDSFLTDGFTLSPGL